MPYIGNTLITTVSDESVTFAKIQDVAANSILGRDANSSGVLTAIALATTQILIGDGTGFTVAALSGDATMANDGAVTLASAQTNIASILRTDVKIGEDDQTKVDFETADEIHFYAANVEQVYVADNIFGPQSDSDVDLGTTGVRWKDAFVDSITVTGEVDAVTLDISGNADIDGTLEADAITIGGVAIGSIYGAVAGSTSILTVGALDTGSITSGFTSIDVGSGAITTTGVITGGTVEATTDTAAGDNAAIGYTSGEGLILTGQGSTNDVTIKNDADTTVISIPTGATGVTFAGTIGSGAITSTGIVTGTGFTAGNAVLAEAELELLDGITAGTAAASKVLVLDANKDIGTIRNLTIDGVFTDGNYTFDTSGNVSGLGTVASGAITSSGIVTGTGFTAGSAVLTEAELELLDGLTAGTAIASKVVTTDANIDTSGQRNLTITGELDAATLDISGDADIDGTTNLDAVDIDGAVQIDNTVTVGVDNTGYDVKYFGATSGAYLLWDESADKLLTAGGAVVDIVKDKLLIGGTAVTTTAAELNLLDALDRGSIIYGNASGVTTVLGQGGANTILTSDGTDISWAAAAGGGVSLGVVIALS